MSRAGSGRQLPFDQPLGALVGWRIDQRLLEPGVETAGRFVSPGAAHGRQVVIAETATDNQDAFITKGSERPADIDVQCRIVAPIQRKLDHRNILVRIEWLHDAEGAVIVAARRIKRRFDSPCAQPLYAIGEVRRARGFVGDVIEVLRKAVVVVDHAGLHARGMAKPFSSQWPETTRIAFGLSPSSARMSISDFSSTSNIRRNSPVMYGQGPPPWLMK
nr:hypothetical protein [Shinella sp. HZN7]